MKNVILILLLLLFSFPAFTQDFHTIYNLPVDKLEEGINIQNLSGINSAGLDYCPVPVKGGLIFTTDRKQKKSWWKRLFSKDYSNLMFAAQTAPGHFLAPINLPGEVNGKFNEGAATLSADGRTMIFTRNTNKKNKKGVYDLNLYSAEFIDGDWKNVVELDLGTSEFTNCHPSLSADGQTLYFASNRPGGYGGMDIYQTNKMDDCWQTPVNMGESINSKSHELFPQLGKRGELYFSSDAEGGLGKLDIWVSRVGTSGTRLPSTNMGFPINSSEDDCSFVVADAGKHGYLTSSRNNGLGGDDLFFWEITLRIEKEIEAPLNEVASLTRIEIKDQDDQLFEDAKLTVIELKAPIIDAPTLSEPFFITNELDSTLVDALGKKLEPQIPATDAFNLHIQSEKTYLVIADHSDYITSQQVLEGKFLLEDQTYAIQLKPNNQQHLALQKATIKVNPAVGPVAASGVDPVASSGVNRVAAPEVNPVAVSGASPTAVSTSITMNDQPIPTLEDPINQTIDEPVVLIAAVPPAAASDEEFTSKGGIILETDKAAIKNTTTYIPIFSSLLYGFNKYILNNESKEQLTDVVSLLRREINTNVIVESHTDSRGNAQYNQELSQKRAQQAKQYLIEQGIPASRIEAIGYGASRPLVDCPTPKDCTEAQHQQNRRTEFILNKK